MSGQGPAGALTAHTGLRACRITRSVVVAITVAGTESLVVESVSYDLLATFGALFGIGGFAALWGAARPALWAAVSAAVPALVLAIAYWRISDFGIDLGWAVVALGLAEVERERRPGVPDGRRGGDAVRQVQVAQRDVVRGRRERLRRHEVVEDRVGGTFTPAERRIATGDGQVTEHDVDRVCSEACRQRIDDPPAAVGVVLRVLVTTVRHQDVGGDHLALRQETQQGDAQRLPVPAGWDDVPRGYLRFSAHYAGAAAEAGERGWRVEHLPGPALRVGEPHQPVGLERVGDDRAVRVQFEPVARGDPGDVRRVPRLLGIERLGGMTPGRTRGRERACDDHLRRRVRGLPFGEAVGHRVSGRVEDRLPLVASVVDDADLDPGARRGERRPLDLACTDRRGVGAGLQVVGRLREDAAHAGEARHLWHDGSDAGAFRA